MTRRNNRCKMHLTKFLMSEEHDAKFCPYCNLWAENNCRHPDCEFCSNRPETPLTEPLPYDWSMRNDSNDEVTK